MKRFWWCVAVFVIAIALGNFVAPPVISSMKPLSNGTYQVQWAGPETVTETMTQTFEVSGGKKNASVRIGDYEAEISRYTAETDRGLVFFFPWEPDKRSFAFYDVEGDATAPLDYIGPGTVDGMRTLEFAGTFTGAGYEAQRTFSVERRSGTVVGATWTVDGATYTLAPAFEAEQIAAAHSTVRILWWLQLLAWVGRFVAFLAAVTGVVLFVRRG